MKGLKKRDMVENVWEKITENSDFVKCSDFIKGSAEGVFGCCSGVSSQKNTYDQVQLL